MSDAKSRYEIVEGLTTNKTQIQDEIAQLKKQVIDKEAGLEKLKRVQSREKSDLERHHSQQMEDSIASVESFKKFAEEQQKALELKLLAYNESIEAIKAISGGIDSQKK